MESVLVLMSTYNGEKYLREQIESILNQENVNVSLLIRDDGSSDNTIRIINSYVKEGNVSLVRGNNLGVANSFFELIKLAAGAEFYAFSDQDDQWDEDKLYIAIQKLRKYSSIPALYSSNTRLVDENLHFIKSENDIPITSLESALIKNYCTGCTVVFNNMLMNELKKYTPSYAVMHDWWINLVVLSVGGLSIYDRTPHMNYRQHGNNVSGAEVSFAKKMAKRFKKFLTKKRHRDVMAKEILDVYGAELTPDTRKILFDFANKRKSLISKKNYKTKKWLDTFLFKVCVIFGRI